MDNINKSRFPFTSFPDGIFAVGFSSEVKPKHVIPITFMNEPIALFRTESGAIAAIESFCPHLGANLALGCVKQETLQCPFHGLRFNKDGFSLAKSRKGNCYQLKKWQAFEKYGLIFLVHNPTQKNLSIHFPTWDMSEWVKPASSIFKIKSHPQEILENSVDQLHFYQVHQYMSVQNTIPFKTIGPEFLVQYQLERRQGVLGRFDRNKIEMKLTIHAYGLGMSHVQIDLPKYGLEGKQIVFLTPIDGEYIHVRALTSIKVPSKIPFLLMAPRFVRKQFANIFTRFAMKGFLQDFLPDLHIWENKKYVADPEYLSRDGDFDQFREWARQFYRLDNAKDRPRTNTIKNGMTIHTLLGNT